MSVGPARFYLRYTPPFDWGFFCHYFQARSTPAVEAVQHGRYTRTINLGKTHGVLQVSHQPSQKRLAVSVYGPAGIAEDAVAARLRRMFDLDADLVAVHRVLLADPRLAPHLRAAPGIRVPGAWSAFEVIARAIVGQQVSVKAASTIMGRIAERFGKPVQGGALDGLRYLFPTPRAVADGDFTHIGMPTRRVAALRNVARAIAGEAIPFSDACEAVAGVKEALLAQPGIGPWTAEYFALRALRDPDAWPGTDLVLRHAVAVGSTARRSPGELLDISAPWRPWRAYAAVHLWNSDG